VQITSPKASPERYLAELAEVIAAERATLVIPVSEETPRVAELSQHLPDSTRVFAGLAEQVRALHDKYRFAQLAASARLPVAASRLPVDMPRQAPWDLVIKPRWSCSGRGLRYVASGDEVHADPTDLIQRRVYGDEFSGFCISIGGRLHAPVVYRAAVTSGSVAVCFERVEDQPRIIEWMQSFAGNLRYTGFLAFDFIVDAKGTPWALECNPRATSGIHFLATNVTADIILGDVPDSGVYRSDALLTEAWSCFTACLARVLRPREFARALTRLLQARDVTWSRHDPAVFLSMPFSTSRIIFDAAVSRSTFAEVAVQDVEWNGSGGGAPEGEV
jgi:predicted ATP-grasp superfamily ATP-dependent carboligase